MAVAMGCRPSLHPLIRRRHAAPLPFLLPLVLVVLLPLAPRAAIAKRPKPCGGAPQEFVPFNISEYMADVVLPVKGDGGGDAAAAALRKLLAGARTRGGGVGRHSGEPQPDYEWEYDDVDDVENDDDKAFPPSFMGGANDTWGVARSADHPTFLASRRLQMPFQVKRIGCRKKLARVYFENARADRAVRQSVRPAEAELIKCIKRIKNCTPHAYGAASKLKAAAMVRKLPRPRTLRKKFFKSCAIVGNAGHMTRKKYGKYIDKHDAVMRFNILPVKDYADFVGSKVSYRMLNNYNTMQACCSGKLPEKKSGNPARVDLVFWFPAGRIEMRRKCKSAYPKTNLHFLTPVYIHNMAHTIRGVRKDLLRLGFGPFFKWKQMTSGAHGILMMMNMCQSLSVYGITSYQESKADQYGGRNKKTRNGNAWHDWKGEMFTWRLLHAMKKIAICSV